MKKSLIGTGIIVFGIILSLIILAKTPKEEKSALKNLYEAQFYQQLENGKVQCNLCPNRCLLSLGQRGLCKVRENIGGKLYSLVYGKPVTTAVDPIEKKPFYHFLPGAKTYSLATAGCNLACKYCQNWDIAQRFPEDIQTIPMTPQQVVEEALKSGSQVIAFTYNEPIIWYEYMLDIAKLAKEKGLRTVMISNGYINQQPLKEILNYLDAVKIDLKSFNNDTYMKLIGGKLEPVLESIKTVYQSGKWLEIVWLVVPGYTDNLEEIKSACKWIKENTSENIPIHFSRFWPKYKLTNLPPTPEETLKKARKVCLEVGMKYVYTGNIDDEEGSITYCPTNKKPLIKRVGYFIKENLINPEGKSPNCPEIIPGVWQ
ncbi:MAG: AmmeMemoRadiSam system radical SAM enzyme [Microgenomates group bacterium]